jgi:RNase P subunit RPR2
MEKLCGKCSKEAGMTKENRYELAKSRIPNTVYTCINCKEEHSLEIKKIKIGIPVEPIKITSEKPKAQKKKKDNEKEQLQLEFF